METLISFKVNTASLNFQPKVVPKNTVILGATATGKTSFAVQLGKKTGYPIYSADSRQLYRRMDLGTGKDLDEYGSVPYRMIDVANPGERWNLAEYLTYFFDKSTKLQEDPVLICGGTGLYLSALIEGYSIDLVPEDKNLRQKLQKMSYDKLTELYIRETSISKVTGSKFPDTHKRLIRAVEVHLAKTKGELQKLVIQPNTSLVYGLKRPDNHRQLILERLTDRLKQGLIEEVKLLQEDIGAESVAYYGLEYKYVLHYLSGELSYSDMVEKLHTEICRYAKRQMTWFRGMERRGVKIKWLEQKDVQKVVQSHST